MNQQIIHLALLVLLLMSACSTPYKPKVHLPNTPIKQVASESYATFKEAIKELKAVFSSQ